MDRVEKKGEKMTDSKRPAAAILGCLSVLLCVGTLAAPAGCSHYYVKDRVVLADLSYAKPAPGGFRYVKRHVTATAYWDSEKSKEEVGSKAYMRRMTSLAAEAIKRLLYKVDLQHNQALYNVRISAPAVLDTYFFYAIFLGGKYWESRASVTITADVIELI
jgi:hypothetical protein